MFLCPRCDQPLSRAVRVGGLQWVCSLCAGRAVTLPVLRRLIDVTSVQRLWRQTAAVTAGQAANECPACEHPMVRVECDVSGHAATLDVCRSCHLVWFDADELERMPAAAVHPSVASRTSEATEALHTLAMMEVDRATGELQRRTAEQMPGDFRLVPALLGLPLELHGAELSSRPWTTWITAAIVGTVSIAAFGSEPMMRELAFVPDQMWRSGGVTMLTAFFVHGGWLHLVGNLWFLVVFGDNVEEFLGRARWLLLLGSATVAGMLLHAFGDARSAVPVVGASGGISGLIAFYALRFPRARLGFLLIVRFVPIWLTLPAWGGFALWMLMQVLFLIEQLSGFGRVSALGHLGGVLAGVVAFLVARKR